MNLLLDTHVLVWALFEPERLPEPVRQALLNPENTLVVSVVSIWEIGIKHHLGKLNGVEPLLSDVDEALKRLLAKPLLISMAHALKAASWKSLHRDPFDRMLAAQADIEKLTLVSADAKLRDFGINSLW